jgi:uncharacterized protein
MPASRSPRYVALDASRSIRSLGVVTPPLSAFPADGYTARWQRWDLTGDETLTLRWENEGWTASGELSGERVNYVVRISPTWQVRQFLLFRDLHEPDLWLGTDGAGRWGEVNGAHRTDLDGCVGIHLPCTPFSHTLSLRRTRVAIGDEVDERVARIDVETLGVVPLHHRYRRATQQRWTYLDHDADESYAFEVDEYGLVRDIDERFRRH